MNPIILVMIVWMQPIGNDTFKSTKVDFLETVPTLEECFAKDPFSEATRLIDAKEQLKLGRVPDLMCAVRLPHSHEKSGT